MNKYFLPVYHSQLKPWIKWWILKRLNGGESTLKAVTISSGTLTKVDKSKALSIKEYYGNAIQDGTPTPDSPVPVQTISGNITFNINSVNYNLDLGDIELCKIGNYKDKIVNDNGTWKIEKKVGKAVADSSYFSGRGTTGTNAYFLETNITTCLNDNTKELSMSDMFRPCSFTNRANGLDITYVQNGRLVIRTANNTNIDWSSATTAKTWLDNNKPILYYALATPTTETITNTNLISQLNALYEFYVNSSTVSISNDSEIPFEVLLEYYGR